MLAGECAKFRTIIHLLWSSNLQVSTAQPTSKTSKSSHKALKIAGICIAVLISTVGLLILGRCFYQRIKRKEKIRFEDYGYSRLKMMEDSLYNDFTDDSDIDGFVSM